MTKAANDEIAAVVKLRNAGARYTGQMGEDKVKTYGGQVGLNVAF